MENKKETLKSILVVFVVLGIIVYYFNINKAEKDVFDYSKGIIEENIIQNLTNESNKEEMIEKIKVYIIGEVQKPGVVELQKGDRIEQAIILAGGTTQYSDLSKINLAYELEDGQKIIVPSIKENVKLDNELFENTDELINDVNEEKVNINKADETELTNLPGVGKALAQRIIVYRKEKGKFKNIEELKNVSGIGEKKYESLKEYIYIK